MQGGLRICSDDEQKLEFNGNQMMVMRVSEKHQKFYPEAFVLKSYGNEESYQWGFDKRKEEVSEKLGITLEPWRSMNNC